MGMFCILTSSFFITDHRASSEHDLVQAPRFIATKLTISCIFGDLSNSKVCSQLPKVICIRFIYFPKFLSKTLILIHNESLRGMETGVVWQSTTTLTIFEVIKTVVRMSIG